MPAKEEFISAERDFAVSNTAGGKGNSEGEIYFRRASAFAASKLLVAKETKRGPQV